MADRRGLVAGGGNNKHVHKYYDGVESPQQTDICGVESDLD